MGRGATNSRDVTGTKFEDAPKYVFATKDKNGNTRWFRLDDNRKVEYGKVGEWQLKDVDYYENNRNIRGFRYHNEWDYSPFGGGTNDNDYNSYGNGGHNSEPNVKKIQPPNDFYRKPFAKTTYDNQRTVPEYLFKDVSGDDFVWKLFQKKPYIEYCRSSNNKHLGICESNYHRECDKDKDNTSYPCDDYLTHYCTNNRINRNNNFCKKVCFSNQKHDKCYDIVKDFCKDTRYVKHNNCIDIRQSLENKRTTVGSTLDAYESDLLSKINHALLDSSGNDEIFTDSIIKSLCTDQSIDNTLREKCDTKAIAFCQTIKDKTDPTTEEELFCACINPEPELPMGYVPVCDGICAGGNSYQRQGEIDASNKCPPCSQKNFSSGSINVGTTQQQTCQIYNDRKDQAKEILANGLPDTGENKDLTQWKETIESGKLHIRYFNSNTTQDQNTYLIESKFYDVNNASNPPFNLTNYKLDFSEVSGSDPIETNYSMYIWGYIKPPKTGNYTFYAQVDDTIKLYIDNNIILNVLNYQNIQHTSVSVKLYENKWHRIKVLHTQGVGAQKLLLHWSSDNAGFTQQNIQPEYLGYGLGDWAEIIQNPTTTTTTDDSGQLSEDEQNAIDILKEQEARLNASSDNNITPNTTNSGINTSNTTNTNTNIDKTNNNKFKNSDDESWTDKIKREWDEYEFSNITDYENSVSQIIYGVFVFIFVIMMVILTKSNRSASYYPINPINPINPMGQMSYAPPTRPQANWNTVRSNVFNQSYPQY